MMTASASTRASSRVRAGGRDLEDDRVRRHRGRDPRRDLGGRRVDAGRLDGALGDGPAGDERQVRVGLGAAEGGRRQPLAGGLLVAAHDDVAAGVGEVDLRHPLGDHPGRAGADEGQEQQAPDVGARESDEVENGHRGPRGQSTTSPCGAEILSRPLPVPPVVRETSNLEWPRDRRSSTFPCRCGSSSRTRPCRCSPTRRVSTCCTSRAPRCTPGLRSHVRAGTDVDVIVRPSGVDALMATLAEHGWRVETTFDAGSAFDHAANLFHESWGLLDVHRHYPGMDRDPAHAFDRLWGRPWVRPAGARPVRRARADRPVAGAAAARRPHPAHRGRPPRHRPELDRPHPAGP